MSLTSSQNRYFDAVARGQRFRSLTLSSLPGVLVRNGSLVVWTLKKSRLLAILPPLQVSIRSPATSQQRREGSEKTDQNSCFRSGRSRQHRRHQNPCNAVRTSDWIVDPSASRPCQCRWPAAFWPTHS